MKNILFIGLLTAVLLSSGCSDKKVEYKDKVTVTQGEISKGIIIQKELASFTFKDQFDKEHSLETNTKKVLFAFSQATGQMIKAYMSEKKEDYLISRDILYIADISGMPSIISKMFAIPSMKEDKFPILLIKEKENATRFRNEEQKNAVMIITLQNKIIQNVKFITSEEDLKKEID